MTLRVAQDQSEVASILLDPSVWFWVTDDASIPGQTPSGPLPDGLSYLLVMDGDTPVGGFSFVRRNAVTWEVHYALLPQARGPERSDPIFQMALAWLWENTPCQRLTVEIPAYNRSAISYAKRNGMQWFATNRNSWLKNGQLHNTELFGLSRGY